MRIPSEAEAWLEVMASLRAGLQTEHRITAQILSDRVAHGEQAGDGIARGLVAQPVVQRERAVELPCVLDKEEVVVPPVILDGVPAGQRLVDVRCLRDVLYKAIQGTVPQQTADGRKEEALYIHPAGVGAVLVGVWADGPRQT